MTTLGAQAQATPPVSRVPTGRVAPGPTGPPGAKVLLDKAGPHGRVVVWETGLLRLLSIDGVVQGATLVGTGPAGHLLDGGDPLIGPLWRLSAGEETRAVLVGLGTGRTAQALAGRVGALQVIEINPIVVEAAKTQFAYDGEVTVGDGAQALLGAPTPLDLVVLDAFEGARTPASLLRPAVIEAVGRRLGEEGVLVVRLLGRPGDARLKQVVDAFRAQLPNWQAMGTGLGGEVQQIAVLLSRRDLGPPPLDELGVSGLRTRWLDGSAAPGPDDSIVKTLLSEADGLLSLAGYLTRGEDGLPYLDLVHYEMGSRRLRLVGPLAEGILAGIGPGATFPTAGDISTDGDLGPTVCRALGGGGVKRSHMRFSPVLVGVQGRLRPLQKRVLTAPQGDEVPAPEPAGKRPGLLTPPPPMRLKQGIAEGAFAELEVRARVLRLAEPAWTALEREVLGPLANKAATAIEAGRFGQALAYSRAADALVEKRFGAWSLKLAGAAEVAHTHALLSRLETLPAGPVQRALALDRLLEALPRQGGLGIWCDRRADSFGQTLRFAMQRPVVAAYKAALGATKDPKTARLLAARLLWHLGELEAAFAEDERPRRDLRKARALAREAEQIKVKWKVKDAASEVPEG